MEREITRNIYKTNKTNQQVAKKRATIVRKRLLESRITACTHLATINAVDISLTARTSSEYIY